MVLHALGADRQHHGRLNVDGTDLESETSEVAHAGRDRLAKVTSQKHPISPFRLRSAGSVRTSGTSSTFPTFPQDPSHILAASSVRRGTKRMRA